MEEVTASFRLAARQPDLKSGYIISAKEGGDSPHTDFTLLCESEWSVRNLSTLKRVETLCSQAVTGGVVTAPRYAPLLENVDWIARDGESSAWVVQSGGDGGDGDGGEKPVVRHIIINHPGQQPLIVDLANSKLFGKVYCDVELGGPVFSPGGGGLLAFTAEEYRPKPTTFLAPPPDDKNDDGGGHGEKFNSLPDWGEQLTGKHRSVVVVVPTTQDSSVSSSSKEADKHKMFSPPQEYGGVGQLQWAGLRSLVGVAYIDASPRLGLIYCKIREAVLFHVDVDEGVFTELTPRGWWVGSPRFSPDWARLVYLRGPVGGPHIREAQMVCRTWGAQPNITKDDGRVVLDYQARLQTLSDGSEFAGLIGATVLPTRCFADDCATVLFNTVTSHHAASYCVNIESGVVSSFQKSLNATKRGSYQVLDVFKNYVLYSHSSFTQTHSLHLAMLQTQAVRSSPTSSSSSVALQPCCALVKGRLVAGVKEDWMDEWMLQNKPKHPDSKYDEVPVSVLYVGPTKKEEGAPLRPLIVFPHGGPHSVVSNSYQLTAGLFVACGYSVVFPNYRGSLGVGSLGVHSLPGHCGTADVADCHAVTTECLHRFGEVLDPDEVFLFGGSHGGFLVTFLSAKHPEYYRCVSALNPVTDMAGMVASSDIPDWSYTESGCESNVTSAPSAADLAKMTAVSPLPLIDRVTAPTLLLLGTADRRVPMSQGMKYHQLLKHRGIPTRVQVYNDCHPLRKVEHEADVLLQTLRWFRQHARVLTKH